MTTAAVSLPVGTFSVPTAEHAYGSLAHAARRLVASQRQKNRTALPSRRAWSGVKVDREWVLAHITEVA